VLLKIKMDKPDKVRDKNRSAAYAVMTRCGGAVGAGMTASAISRIRLLRSNVSMARYVGKILGSQRRMATLFSF
jgi:hypothetical protein